MAPTFNLINVDIIYKSMTNDNGKNVREFSGIYAMIDCTCLTVQKQRKV